MEPDHSAPNRTIKVGKWLLLACFGTIVSYVFLFPQLFYSQTIGRSGFRNIGKDVFVSPEILKSQNSLIQEVISEGKMRVDSFYSGLRSKPTFIICSTPVEYERYCNGTEGTGCSLGTPWGESYVVVNLEGVNVDVVSHELSHIELLERLGWWETTFSVPQWFNEGLALMLDRRFVDDPDPVRRYVDYSEEWLIYSGGQTILELHEIAGMNAFFKGSQRQVMLAYMTSGMEVSYWLASMNNDGFAQFLKLTESGLPFMQAYERVQMVSRSNVRRLLPMNPLRVKDVTIRLNK